MRPTSAESVAGRQVPRVQPGDKCRECGRATSAESAASGRECGQWPRVRSGRAVRGARDHVATTTTTSQPPSHALTSHPITSHRKSRGNSQYGQGAPGTSGYRDVEQSKSKSKSNRNCHRQFDPQCVCPRVVPVSSCLVFEAGNVRRGPRLRVRGTRRGVPPRTPHFFSFFFLSFLFPPPLLPTSWACVGENSTHRDAPRHSEEMVVRNTSVLYICGARNPLQEITMDAFTRSPPTDSASADFEVQIYREVSAGSAGRCLFLQIWTHRGVQIQLADACFYSLAPQIYRSVGSECRFSWQIVSTAFDMQICGFLGMRNRYFPKQPEAVN